MQRSRLCNDASYSNNIAVVGLCEDKEEVNNIIKEFSYWKEINLQTLAAIPDTSPNIEYVNTVKIAVDILNVKVIKTPRTSEISVNGQVMLTENLEGMIVTGRKIIINGRVCQTIEYGTGDPYDNIRSMKVYNPFSAYIIVPRELNINGQELDALLLDFQVNSCIEDLQVRIFDCRRIMSNIFMMFYAIPRIA